jgi:hypothetical protein
MITGGTAQNRPTIPAENIFADEKSGGALYLTGSFASESNPKESNSLEGELCRSLFSAGESGVGRCE